MGIIKKYHAVKLVIGFIFKDETALRLAKKALIKKFGGVDYESPTLPFTHTDYYEAELGLDLKRKFISFERLILPQGLPRIKIYAAALEKKLSRCSKRLVNIDPGYLDMAKFVLASTKDYSHRVYLDKGILAEITLSYRNKTFGAREWTYPDYGSGAYIEIFNHIRDIYASQIENK